MSKPSTVSTHLLKATSIYWAGASVLHGYLSIQRLNPYFGSSTAFEPFVFKNISLQLSGYFVINGGYQSDHQFGITIDWCHNRHPSMALGTARCV